MTFLFISVIAGVLTVLAPCILPLLPVVVGSSATGRSKATPYIIVASLSASVILFTYLLKVSTAFIMVPSEVWAYISGGILFFFGITLAFPAVWERIPGLSRATINSNKILGAGHMKKSFWGDVIVGAALGPVFSTCSPTYFVIIASVLPASFALGSLYLFAYTFGLACSLLLIALLGERFASKLEGFSDPKSVFKRGLGVLFIILGLAVAFGYEKKLEASILSSGYFDITRVEQSLLQKNNPVVDPYASTDTPNTDSIVQTSVTAPNATTSATTSATVSPSTRIKKIQPLPGKPYVELVNPSGYVNTNDLPIKIGDYVGKKVILLDIMTYSCINCQRTFPYANAWYEKYKDDGLIIIGIHTPEFAFEKVKQNVADAMQKFGIKFPVVLDNDYGTWRALGNSYWPRKYLIDIHGNIVYDHIGEGGYDETEMKIRDLLAERKQMLGEQTPVAGGALVETMIPQVKAVAKSSETYFGSGRNEYLANGERGVSGAQTLTIPQNIEPNQLYLGGTWNFMDEYATADTDATISYMYDAGDVYFVADADAPVPVEVWQDGALISDAKGSDVGTDGIAHIHESRLYKIVHNKTPGKHSLMLRIKGKGLRAYTFTFG